LPIFIDCGNSYICGTDLQSTNLISKFAQRRKLGCICNSNVFRKCGRG